MKVGDKVICISSGSFERKEFIIVAKLSKEGWFSCLPVDGENQRYHQFHERHLEIIQ